MTPVLPCDEGNSIIDRPNERRLEFSFYGRECLPTTPPKRLAVLLTTEFEGLGQNGGVGTYYRELATALSSSGWTTLLVILGGFIDVTSALPPPRGVDYLLDLSRFAELFELRSLHRALLKGTEMDPNQCTGLKCFFLLQALEDYFSGVPIYAEFHEMFGFGFLSAKARTAGLLGQHVSVAVTMHSGHEWIYDANRAILDRNSRAFLRIAVREDQSFLDATLSMYPSDSLHDTVQGYGWNMDHAIRIPYQIPIHASCHEPVPKHISSSLPEVIFFGRLEERKGLFEFIDAVLQLADGNNSDFLVTFLGKSIPLFSAHLPRTTSIEYISSRLQGIVPFRVLSNYSSDRAIAHVKASRRSIVCLASPSDNFPNAALEMGQIPVPLVVSDTVGFHQTLSLVERTDEVYWFEPSNIISLHAQLKAALTSNMGAPIHVADPHRLEAINRQLLAQRRQLIEASFAFSPPPESVEEPLVLDHTQGADASRLFVDGLALAGSLAIEYVLSALPTHLPCSAGLAELIQAGQRAGADLVWASEWTEVGLRCVDAVSIADVMHVDFLPPGCLLVRRDALASLETSPNAKSVLELHRQLVAAAIVTGCRISVLPYPLIDSPSAAIWPVEVTDKSSYQVNLIRFLSSISPERFASRAFFHLMLSQMQVETAYQNIMPEDSLRRLLTKLPAYLIMNGRLVFSRYRRVFRRLLRGQEHV